MDEVRRKTRLESWQNRQPDAVDEFSYSGEKWEYRFETLSEKSSTAEDELNMFGGQGWELVLIDFTQRSAYFKRKAAN